MMTHLIVCREYPPAPYAAGGIGTYVRHMARLLAAGGDTVHVVAQRWEGAPLPIESVEADALEDRLILHRIPLDEPIQCPPAELRQERQTLRRLASSTCPSQVFAWQVARYAEHLLRTLPIDLIEAQEWEAPLYYLQVRRALGLGPAQVPPIVVHLHSPSVMIFRHNGWDESSTDYLPLCRLEEYSIRAADRLLCPSRFLADGVTAHFRLPPGSIDVVPYPLGDSAEIDRTREVWAAERVSYVGRLELRKGVLEWIDAAVDIARIRPQVIFDFYGSDTSVDGTYGRSLLELLRARIPRRLRARFRFHGSVGRPELAQALALTSIAVVPSRWENLPFTCIEAMASGLPVLASPHGGMRELVTDSVSGWIATDCSRHALAAALLRALETLPEERRAMGQRAARSARHHCGNAVVLAQHQFLRRQLAATGAGRSRRVPGDGADVLANQQRQGVGVILTCFDSPERLEDAIESILDQSLPGRLVVLVSERLRRLFSSMVEVYSYDFPLVFTRLDEPAAVQDGLARLLALDPHLRAVVLLNQDVDLSTDALAFYDEVFARQPGVGMVAPWVLQPAAQEDLDPGPSPLAPGKNRDDPLPPGCALRVELMLEAPANLRTSPQALLRRGFSAVTHPGILATLAPLRGRSAPRRRYSGMALIQTSTLASALRWFRLAPAADRRRFVFRMLREPARMFNAGTHHLRSRRVRLALKAST